MTITLSARGQIVIPNDVRTKLKLRSGDDFMVLTSSTGDILLRPVRRRRKGKGLYDALRALRGLELNPSTEPIREIQL